MNIKPLHIALGAGAVLAGGYLLRLFRASKNLEVFPTLRIHSLDFRALKIAVQARIQNPTGQGLRIKQPFIRLIHGGQTVGTSQASGADVLIPANGEVRLPEMLIEIPLINLTGFAGELLRYIRKQTDTVRFEVEVLTTAFTPVSKIPVKVKETIELKRKSDAG